MGNPQQATPEGCKFQVPPNAVHTVTCVRLELPLVVIVVWFDTVRGLYWSHHNSSSGDLLQESTDASTAFWVAAEPLVTTLSRAMLAAAAIIRLGLLLPSITVPLAQAQHRLG
jgi:hypothetical protein